MFDIIYELLRENKKGILLEMTLVWSKLIKNFLTELLDKYLLKSLVKCKIEFLRITVD